MTFHSDLCKILPQAKSLRDFRYFDFKQNCIKLKNVDSFKTGTSGLKSLVICWWIWYQLSKSAANWNVSWFYRTSGQAAIRQCLHYYRTDCWLWHSDYSVSSVFAWPSMLIVRLVIPFWHWWNILSHLSVRLSGFILPTPLRAGPPQYRHLTLMKSSIP